MDKGYLERVILETIKHYAYKEYVRKIILSNVHKTKPT